MKENTLAVFKQALINMGATIKEINNGMWDWAATLPVRKEKPSLWTKLKSKVTLEDMPPKYYKITYFVPKNSGRILMTTSETDASGNNLGSTRGAYKNICPLPNEGVWKSTAVAHINSEGDK